MGSVSGISHRAHKKPPTPVTTRVRHAEAASYAAEASLPWQKEILRRCKGPRRAKKRNGSE